MLEKKYKIVKGFVEKLDVTSVGYSKDIKNNVIDTLYLFVHLFRKIHKKNNHISKKQLADIGEILGYSVNNRTTLKVGRNHPVTYLEPNLKELDALTYFTEQCVDKVITDKHGKMFVCKEDSFNHVYKNHHNNAHQNHEPMSQYYQVNRARRLPLIKYVIENTMEIYKHRHLNKFMHVGFIIREIPHKPPVNYVQIIISEWNKKDKQYNLVTSYTIMQRHYFKKLHEFVPFRQ